MIAFETPQFSIVLGVDEIKRQSDGNPIVASFVIEDYPLSHDEATTNFTMLSPSEAIVDRDLHETLSKMPTTVDALGLRIALIRWSDGAESLVGFSVDQTVPSPALLKSSYRSAHGVIRLRASFAKHAEGNHHG